MKILTYTQNVGNFVAILVKKAIQKCINVLKNDDDFSIWFTVTNLFSKELLLCCLAYVPPENTKYSPLDMFESLENQLLEFKDFNHNFCIIGDLNARTADKCD